MSSQIPSVPPLDLSLVPQELQRFFIKCSPATTKADPLVSLLLGPQAQPVRSFAFVITVSDYAHFPKLPAAEEDRLALEGFLQRQGFDEIIVLKERDVTEGNINSIFNYLEKQVDARGEGSARVLVAYSGHGVGGIEKGKPGSLVFWNAEDSRDLAHLYKMKSLEMRLTTLGEKEACFHLLALINACNAGGLFWERVASGGNDLDPTQKGAHLISAVNADESAWALPNGHGSIFFNILIGGIDSGDADPKPRVWIQPQSGSAKCAEGGFVRYGMLTHHLHDRIVDLGLNPFSKQPYPDPAYGSIRTDESSKGAFFFLGPPLKSIKELFGVDTPPDLQLDGSFIVGLPGFKLFALPESYAIIGVDVNSYSGKIDWVKVAATPKVKFAYIRASYQTKDSEFDGNWAGARAAGLKHGAYHVFDPQASLEKQFDLIKSCIPIDDPDALPLVIDLEVYPESDAEAIAVARQKILRLRTLCEERFHKPPVLCGGSRIFADLTDHIGDKNSIWLADALPLDGSSRRVAGAIDPTVGRQKGSAFVVAPQKGSEFTVTGVNIGADSFTVVDAPGGGGFQNIESPGGFQRDLPPEPKLQKPAVAGIRRVVRPDLPGKEPWTFWQLDEGATIDGISGRADVSAFFGTADDFAAFARGEKGVAVSKALRMEGHREKVILAGNFPLGGSSLSLGLYPTWLWITVLIALSISFAVVIVFRRIRRHNRERHARPRMIERD